jgi:hypothetical protein
MCDHLTSFYYMHVVEDIGRSDSPYDLLSKLILADVPIDSSVFFALSNLDGSM